MSENVLKLLVKIDRQTTDRQTHTQTDRQTNRHRHTHRQIDRQADNLYVSTIIKATQLMGSCINTN